MYTLTHAPSHRFSPVELKAKLVRWVHFHWRWLKHVLRVTAVATIIFVIVNLGLMLLQRGKLTPFTTINGKSYGLMSVEKAKEALATEHSQAVLSLKVGDKIIALNAEQSGVALKADETLSPLTDKRGLEKIPLVNAVGNLFISLESVYSVDVETLASKLASYVTDELVPATNATVTISTDLAQPVVIVPEVAGYELNALIAAQQVKEQVANGDFTLKINRKTLLPTWDTQDFDAFLPAIEAARRTSMTIAAGSQRVVLSSELLAPMLRVNTSGSSLKMTLDGASLRAYLDSQAKIFYEAPVSTKTVLKDGVEVSRVEGVAGKRLDTAATSELAITAFENGVLTVEPALPAVTPDTVVTRTYSNTDNGLFKMIEDFDAAHAGAYRVSAVELSGPSNRSAFYRADESTVTASTYKVFIAYAILQKIEQGGLSMDSASSQGSVSYCLGRMIIVSDNACASALGALYGWTALDSKLAAEGYSATRLNNQVSGDKKSTARDETTLLTRLYFHENLGASSVDYLFDLMKQQIYRQGIIAGSRGSAVAAKVGFLGSLYHDMGIVYSPKATYSLVIMTDGAGGFTNIKLLSQQIYDFYNQ